MRRGLVVGSLSVAAFAAVLAWALWPPDETPYHDMVARLRAAGEPVDVEGLRERDVPPEENGAADLASAFVWLEENVTQEQWDAAPGPWSNGLPDDWRDHVTPEQREAAARFAEQLAPFFERVHAAVRKRRIQFRGPLDGFGFATDDHVRHLQTVTRTMFAGMFGPADPARRVEEMRTTIELARRTESDSLIDHMIVAAVHRSALSVLRDELSLGRLDPREARAALDPLLRDRWIPRLPAMARAERASAISIYRGVLAGFPNPYVTRPPWYRRLWDRLNGKADDDYRPGMAKDVVAYCDGLGVLSGLPPEDSDLLRKKVSELAVQKNWPGLNTMFAGMMRRLEETEAMSAMARLALAAAEHRARHGTLPVSLSDLAWAFPEGLPANPLTNGAFVLSATPDGLRITTSAAPVGVPASETVDDAWLRERGLLWELAK